MDLHISKLFTNHWELANKYGKAQTIVTTQIYFAKYSFPSKSLYQINNVQYKISNL